MATETLRPNAAGDETNIDVQWPSSGAHWDKVDDTGAGDESTYVYSWGNGKVRDLYHLPASSGQGPINKITVYTKTGTYRSNDDWGKNWIAMKTGGIAYEHYTGLVAYHFTLYNHEWATNPQSGVAWTWDNIDALQIGVAVEGEQGSNEYGPWWVPVFCTQVYVEVDYIPYSDIGIRLRTSSGTIKIGTQALDGHKLRIRKGGTTYGIPLITPGDANDSGVRIWDGSAVKALPKVD